MFNYSSGLIRFYCFVILGVLALPTLSYATVVRMVTAVGVVDIRLYETSAPLTVDNFLRYANRGDYNSTFFHRSLPGFILQGGGYGMDVETNVLTTVRTLPPVINEFSLDHSNLRGTIAMAKLNDEPNSATSQWFFNLTDNSANLDYQNAGFTVFAEVMGRGMEVVDALVELPIVNAGDSLSNLPLYRIPEPGEPVTSDHLVMISSLAVLPTIEVSDSDRLFNYLEELYPEYISPANAVSATVGGYYYRYYPGTNSYVATRDSTVYYLGPASDNGLLSLGDLSHMYNQAVAAGY